MDRAYKVLSVEVQEFHRAGKRGAELRRIIEDSLEGAAHSLELSQIERQAVWSRLWLVELPPETEVSPQSEDRPIQGKAKGGRPATLIDGNKLRKLRGDTEQTVFARMCRVSVDTVQRAEGDGHASVKSIKKFLKGLKLKGHHIEREDLEKNTPH